MQAPAGFLGVFFAFCCLACSRNAAEQLPSPPSTPPLSRQCIGYGVINSSFALVMSRPDPKSSSQGYQRRGAAVDILERRLVPPLPDSPGESWVRIEQGWVPESMVDIFDTPYQAQTAARNMTQ